MNGSIRLELLNAYFFHNKKDFVKYVETGDVTTTIKDRTNHSQVKNRCRRDGDLSTPAIETSNQIKAHPAVVKRTEQERKLYLKNHTDNGTKKGEAYTMNLADNIKAIREAKGLKQIEVATISGWTSPLTARLKRG